MILGLLNQLKYHPKGLLILFFVEVWERFSYYGMRAILILFLVSSKDNVNPGMGWTKIEALELYGWYTALVYFACIPGGVIADRILGKKKSVALGGLLLCFGHFFLAIQNNFFFFFGISLIIFGVGLLKPNISSLVGTLYSKNEKRRDQGFTIFYIGINIGAFFASLIVGYVGEFYGWHYGFSLAGFGMVLGQITYIYGSKYIPEEKLIYPKNKRNVKNHIKFSKIELDRLQVLAVSFLIIIVFWASFEQAGGLMNLYAYEKTNRNISFFDNIIFPASWFQGINPLLIIILGLPISTLWLSLERKKYHCSSLFKMIIGLSIMSLGFVFMYFASEEYSLKGSSAMYWIILAYLFHTIGELCASPVILSFITKLAPLKYTSSVMGIYFAAMGLGNKLASNIGQESQEYGESEIFISITFFCLGVSFFLIIFLKKLNKMTHNADK